MKIIEKIKNENPITLGSYAWLNLFILSAILQSLALFMLFFIACQLWVLGVFAFRWYMYFQSKNWKSRDIDDIKSTCCTMYQDSAPRTNLDIEFTYFVNGKEFKNSRFQYPFFFATTKRKHEVDYKINQGEYTKVLVNPSNPKQSALSNDLLFRDVVMTLIYLAGAFIVFYSSIVIGIGTLLVN